MILRHTILGAPIDALTLDESLKRIASFCHDGGIHQVVTANPEMLVAAQNDASLATIIQQADLVTADGNGILLAGRLLNAPFPERVTGIDLAEALCARSAELDLSLFFLGSRPGVAADAALRMQKKYPGARIVGSWHGYFFTHEENMLTEIRLAQPDVLLVGLGSPRQEQFIRDHQADLGVPVAIGVGGSFDVLSGRLNRAPKWVQRIRLEFLYRLLQEPSRWKRHLNLGRFLTLIFRSRCARSQSSGH